MKSQLKMGIFDQCKTKESSTAVLTSAKRDYMVVTRSFDAHHYHISVFNNTMTSETLKTLEKCVSKSSDDIIASQ